MTYTCGVKSCIFYRTILNNKVSMRSVIQIRKFNENRKELINQNFPKFTTFCLEIPRTSLHCLRPVDFKPFLRHISNGINIIINQIEEIFCVLCFLCKFLSKHINDRDRAKLLILLSLILGCSPMEKLEVKKKSKVGSKDQHFTVNRFTHLYFVKETN